MAEVAAEREPSHLQPGRSGRFPEVFSGLDRPRRTAWVKITRARERHQSLVDGKSRIEKAPARGHSSGVGLGEKDPVLDGAGSGLDRPADGVASERVHHDGAVAAASLVHGNCQVLKGELRVKPTIGRCQHASRGN